MHNTTPGREHAVELLLLFFAFLSLCLPARSQSGVQPDSQPFATAHELLMQDADTLLLARDPAPAEEPLSSVEHLEPSPAGRALPAGSRDSSASRATDARLQQFQSAISPILEQQGIPPQLSAVASVESGGNPGALSSKGARGLWQLMPDTARRYGLVVDDRQDERLDVQRATYAAARYLKDLHDEFGSWPLVLAAYNTGERNLRQAMEKSQSSDYFKLSSLHLLPAETRSYVPTVLARMPSFSAQPFLPASRNTALPAHIVFAATTFPSTPSPSRQEGLIQGESK